MAAPADGDGARPRVAVLADDLIWGTRLSGAVQAAGGEPLRARDLGGFVKALDGVSFALVDATARAYAPLEAVGIAAGRNVHVICVAQHDDATLRTAARAAGAERVLAYRAMSERGVETIRDWLAGGGGA